MTDLRITTKSTQMKWPSAISLYRPSVWFFYYFCEFIILKWKCSSSLITYCPAIGYQPVQDVPRLLPKGSWHRYIRDPCGDKWLRKWMGGWMGALHGRHSNIVCQVRLKMNVTVSVLWTLSMVSNVNRDSLQVMCRAIILFFPLSSLIQLAPHFTISI